MKQPVRILFAACDSTFRWATPAQQARIVLHQSCPSGFTRGGMLVLCSCRCHVGQPAQPLREAR